MLALESSSLDRKDRQKCLSCWHASNYYSGWAPSASWQNCWCICLTFRRQSKKLLYQGNPEWQCINSGTRKETTFFKRGYFKKRKRKRERKFISTLSAPRSSMHLNCIFIRLIYWLNQENLTWHICLVGCW